MTRGVAIVSRARGLSTARAVLRVLTLLARAPRGLRADEVAEALGKSTSTAYNLLDSLCEEGFATHDRGRYRLADPANAVAAAMDGSAPRMDSLAAALQDAPLPTGGLAGAVDELFAGTHKRAYLAVFHGGRTHVPIVRGQQGMRRIPGLGTDLGANAHALALGKLGLAQLDPAGLRRYVGDGLTAFTPATIVDPAELSRALARIRHDGIADDREEFAADSCCLAAPLRDDHGRTVAALGISMPRRAFEQEHDELTELLLDVARRARVPTIREEAARSCPPDHPAPSVAIPSAEMEVSA